MLLLGCSLLKPQETGPGHGEDLSVGPNGIGQKLIGQNDLSKAGQILLVKTGF
jgi:hypothetical protein